MPLLNTRLNTARFNSIKADLMAQFPVNTELLPGEQLGATDFYNKIAHAIADNEGTDVVAEITGNAVLNVASVSGVTTGPSFSGPGTGTIS